MPIIIIIAMSQLYVERMVWWKGTFGEALSNSRLYKGTRIKLLEMAMERHQQRWQISLYFACNLLLGVCIICFRVRLGVLCITLELILNPLHSFAELWPRGRISSLAVLEVGVDGGCIKALCGWASNVILYLFFSVFLFLVRRRYISWRRRRRWWWWWWRWWLWWCWWWWWW